jgi:hypothetical protein
MKLVKSLLLGSAAGVLAVASAQAADLPTRKAAPAEYVRICDAYGAGFFYIPGTETCLQLSGMVRAEYLWRSTKNYGVPAAATTTFAVNPTTGAIVATAVPANAGVVSGRSRDDIGMFARGRLNVDARTQTSWGTLRSYFRYEIQHSSAAYVAGTADGSWGVKDTARLYYGFIQFAGITAGRAQSFFDFYANAWNYGTLRMSDNSVNLLAYTATFGGGFSATLSIEDPSARSWGVGRSYNGLAVAATGAKYPDVIGALRVDQGWGSAQLSGAWGHRTTQAGTFPGAWHKDYNAWAVKAGVKINLPMLAAGDELYLEATYARGAADYLGGVPGIAYSGYQAPYYSTIAYLPSAAATNYSISMNKGWSAMAAFQHYWAPSFRTVLMGSYLDVDYDSVAKNVYGLRKGNEWRVGGMAIWSPVKGMDIGLELIYAKVHNSVTPAMAAAIRAAGLKKDPDSFEARLRIQRNF